MSLYHLGPTSWCRLRPTKERNIMSIELTRSELLFFFCFKKVPWVYVCWTLVRHVIIQEMREGSKNSEHMKQNLLRKLLEGTYQASSAALEALFMRSRVFFMLFQAPHHIGLTGFEHVPIDFTRFFCVFYVLATWRQPGSVSDAAWYLKGRATNLHKLLKALKKSNKHIRVYLP